MENIFFNLITDRDAILEALTQSKIRNSVIGINSPVLGSGTFLTSVSDILISLDDDPVVVLKSFDITGYFLNKNTVSLRDIKSVIPFTSVFENPFLKAYKTAHEV